MTRLFVSAAALLLSLPAAAQRTPPTAAERVERLAERLDISGDQRAELDALAARHADAQPGASWSLAADLADVLSDEQVAALRSERGERRRGRRGEMRRRGRDGARGASRRGADRLPEETRERMRGLRDEARAERRALVERFRSGALDAAAFEAERRELRDATRARMAALLPAELQSRHSERAQRRELQRAARADALGLTAEQQQRLRALRLDALRSAPARPDRDALREMSRDERRALRDAHRDARRAQRDAAADVLTERQREVLAIHRALAGRHGHLGRMHRRGR